MTGARKLLVTVAVLGVLFGVANVVAEKIAEARLADEAQRSFATSEKPIVSIAGFPILVNVLRGTIPRASVEGRGLVVQELKVSRLRIDLERLQAKIGDLAGGKPIRVGRGRAEAEVTSADVNAYVRSRVDRDIRVEAVRDGVVVTGTMDGVGLIRAQGTPKLTGRLLTFTPSQVTVNGRPVPPAAAADARRRLAFEIDLPVLPGSVRITAVEYDPGIARLIARIEDATIDLGKL